MKKFLAILLALTLCFGCVAFAEEGTISDSTALNTLTVGVTEMNGDFIDGFGNSSYDAFIKTMLHEFCYTVETTAEGELVINPQIVAEYTAEPDEDGNKVYTFTLCDDLKWSDGSSITASDYVGALLWKASDEWITAGASSSVGLGLLGYKDYLAGETDVFAGVKLIDELTFSMTIDAAELPYFYETAYVQAGPIPMAVYAPGCEIVSDENGSSFGDYDILTAMNNVAATERFAPSISCGPYKFISFENSTVTLEANEYFKGDLDGDKPSVKYIVQKVVPNDTDVDSVIAGSIDLVTGVIEGKKIEAAKADPNTNLNSYLRNGYGYLTMCCDWGVTADPNVRWALGYLIDRNTVIDYVLEGYGGMVHAEYGYAQWMYEYAGDELEEELTAFNLNIEKANELLDQTEWKYESDGTTPFDASKANADGTYMRYNDKGEMLTINHLGTDENPVTDIIEIQYKANAPLAGVNFVVTKGDFAALLDNYQNGYQMGDDRKYNTFNLATSFDAVFDPYTSSWHSDYCGTWINACQLSDPELDEIIMKMRSVEPGDNDTFVDYWLQYELRWQELLPQIPLYSNEYFDIFSNTVTGVETTPFYNYANVICKIGKISADEAAAAAEADE
ncbi:MAG: ABC transporter substrate-binding protein [Clostridia bacterium]|nr:ABC transporter substrate-binding protein [Clostridia bacterium]